MGQGRDSVGPNSETTHRKISTKYIHSPVYTYIKKDIFPHVIYICVRNEKGKLSVVKYSHGLHEVRRNTDVLWSTVLERY